MIGQIIQVLFELYSTLILVYCIMSWFPNAYQTKLGQLLVRLCQPYLEIFERFIPPVFGISFAPWVGLIALQFIEYGVFAILRVL